MSIIVAKIVHIIPMAFSVFLERFIFNLLQLNIKNTNDTFVVNYKTGEVYNETVQVTSNKSNLYINMLNPVIPGLKEENNEKKN